MRLGPLFKVMGSCRCVFETALVSTRGSALAVQVRSPRGPQSHYSEDRAQFTV